MRSDKTETRLEQAFLDASESEPMCQIDLMLLDLVHDKGITYKNLVDSCRWIAETADKALAKAKR